MRLWMRRSRKQHRKLEVWMQVWCNVSMVSYLSQFLWLLATKSLVNLYTEGGEMTPPTQGEMSPGRQGGA